MVCPHCGFKENRVLDTRMQREGDIRRRRECESCMGRFTTIELVLKSFPYVIKKDGRREQFNKDKLRKGIQLACSKRPVSLVELDQIVARVSQLVLNSPEKEIGTIAIGQAVMEELKKVDDVAYVRFASVYKTFQDVQEFVRTLNGGSS